MYKQLLLMMLTISTTISCTILSSEQQTEKQKSLVFPFTPDSAQNWSFVSDRVMGGVSEGQASLEQDKDISFARLTGNVSTKNNGGFIQLRSSSSWLNKPLMFRNINDSEKAGQELQGVRLNVRGNGETYYIFIQTNQTRSPSDNFQASFQTNNAWQTIEIPFKQFVRERINYNGSTNLVESHISPKNIRSIGITAYGRDFAADLSVSQIEFYY